MKPTLADALESLGIVDGWAGNEQDGIILWDRTDEQPTRDELVAAGWIPQINNQEATEE